MEQPRLSKITLSTKDTHPDVQKTIKPLLDLYTSTQGAHDAIPIELEYSIHPCPKRLQKELYSVFPSIQSLISSNTTQSISDNTSPQSLNHNLLVIPTFQRCQWDLVGTGPHIEQEKDEKLHSFYIWAGTVCHQLRRQGYWADITDPASGYPVFSERGASVYPDVCGAQRLLRYDVMNTGCCRVLLHPRWGSRVYPATLFAIAPEDVVEMTISEMIHNKG